MPDFENREDLAAMIEHEGGVDAAIDYGIVAADLPDHDEELRFAWARATDAHRIFKEAEGRILDLLNTDDYPYA